MGKLWHYPPSELKMSRLQKWHDGHLRKIESLGIRKASGDYRAVKYRNVQHILHCASRAAEDAAIEADRNRRRQSGTPLEALGLPSTIKFTLEVNNIVTVEELSKKTDSELRALYNIGKKKIAIIRSFIPSHETPKPTYGKLVAALRQIMIVGDDTAKAIAAEALKGL